MERTKQACDTEVYTARLETPLGQMLAISSEYDLYLLEFADQRGLERKIEFFKIKARIIPAMTPPIIFIEKELKSYFDGSLKQFSTSFHFLGSDFQKKVWNSLLDIPYGTTSSYLAQAKTIGNPLACRAVANANGANPLAILVPCHRIINNSGELGGYGGGIHRKQWLINHEKNYSQI